jgi:hypothetical protein
MKEIIVTVAEDGSVVVETKGFKGASCQKATEELERSLGKKVSETKTPEWHLKEQQKEGQR